MSRTLQLKRYASTVVANTRGAAGELIIDTTNNILTIHDGIKVGGHNSSNATNILAQAGFNQANSAVLNTITLQGALNTANANITYILNAVLTQNTNISNANILAQAGFNQANSAVLNTITLQGGLDTANANITYILNAVLTQNTNISNANILAQAAFSAANNAAQTIPQNARTTDYTLIASDAGKHLYYTQSANVNLYIPWSSNASFANGTTIMIVSRTTSSANVTVTPNTGVTMYLAGNTISASRNVTTYGIATLMQVDANTWFINGNGIT